MAATVRPITLGRYSDSVDAKDDEVTLLDNKKIYLGTGNDLEIYHDGSNSRIDDTGTGNLKLQVGGSDKLEVTSTGISVTGDISATGSVSGILSTSGLDLADNEKILLGTGDDLEIFHDASHSWIKDTGTGHLKINTSNLRINNAANTENLITADENGAVKLFYDDVDKLETTASGIKVASTSGLASSVIQTSAASDVELEFVNTNSSNRTWAIGLDNSNSKAFVIATAADTSASLTSGEQAIVCKPDGEVELYYNNVKTLETKSDGVAITGNTYFDPATSASTTGSYFQSASAGRAILHIGGTSTASSSNKVIFANPNGTVGSITTDANATNFNTSSDYRLKENTVSISDGITRLKTLKPYRFNFKSDPTTTVDGFFAHEVTAVPEAVAGEKDGTEMQGMDYGRITPLLTAALQEAITKIETLETKVAALEAG